MAYHIRLAVLTVILFVVALAAFGAPIPEPAQWFHDTYRDFRVTTAALHNEPRKPPAEQTPIRKRCVDLTRAYNTVAATMHPGLFKRERLPATLSASECV